MIDDSLKYQREKTSKNYDIKVTEHMEMILKFYLFKRKKMTFSICS